MTLTGQGIFDHGGGMVPENEIKGIINSVDRFLKRCKKLGTRLNTDFALRALFGFRDGLFGFAYGTKENGAFFSHMNVMYATGLYQRGFCQG